MPNGRYIATSSTFIYYYIDLLGSATEVHEQHMIQTVTELFQDEMPEDIKCHLK